MEKKQIRRKVHRVANDGQRTLFHRGEATAPAAEESGRGGSGAVGFQDPSPEGILISDQPLADYLSGCGETEVFQLREFLREQDWSAFEERYQGSGRPPYAPSLMVGLILFGIMQGKDSLRSLEREARFNIRCWWLTGGVSPDHSAIGRFIALHAALLSRSFFESLTRAVLGATGGGSRELGGDATVTQAAASAYRRVREEAAAQAAREARRKALEEPQDEKAARRAEQADRVLDALRERNRARRRNRRHQGETSLSPSEPEAVVQPLKNKAVAPSYRPSVLANPQRIIVAQHVEPSSEQEAVEPMLDQARRVGPEPPEWLLADGGYFHSGVLKGCAHRRVRLLSPPPADAPTGVFPKRAFCYHKWKDAYLCPQGHELVRLSVGSDRGRRYVRYGRAPCGRCAMRSRCTRSRQGRVIKRYGDEAHKQHVRDLMSRPEMQKKYRRRKAWVEPVFAEIKHVQGLDRFRRRGLDSVRLEFSLHAMAHNLRRLLRLTPPHPGHDRPYCGLRARLIRFFKLFGLSMRPIVHRLAPEMP